ncbi:MAG: class I SAM-dependent methyltransferase [Candidatus Methanomethylicia archaeon]
MFKKLYELQYQERQKPKEKLDLGWYVIEYLSIFKPIHKMSTNMHLILEVGIGSQPRSLIALNSRIGEFVGCDISRVQLKYAKRHYRGSYIVCDLEHLPFRERVFDGVFCLGVLHHLSSWQKGLTEMVRVIKIGGVLGLREAVFSKNSRLIALLSRRSDPQEEPIREVSLLWEISKKFTVVHYCRVFPRIRMPLTFVIFKLFPSLVQSVTFWKFLWNFDNFLDSFLGGKIYLFRGAALLMLAVKLTK